MSALSLLLLLVQPGFPADEAAAKEPHVFLEDYAPCGVVSLYLVCRMREIPVTWEKLKELVGQPGPDGSHSFEQLSRAATQLGLHPVILHMNREGLSRIPMPLIAQVHNPYRPDLPPHLLVLLKATADGVILLDAPFSPNFLPDSRFREFWTGNVLVFAPDREYAQSLRTAAHTQTGLYTALWAWGGVGGSLLFLAIAASQGRSILSRLRRSKRLLFASFLLLLLPASVWGIIKFTAKTRPHCVFDMPVINLGELAPGEHSVRVSLANPGDEPLHISAIKSSCTCAVVKPPETIGGRQQATIEVKIHVSPGPRGALLEIHSNDPDGPKTVAISWHGTTKPFLVPARIQSLPVPFDRDYERIVHVVYPGGRKALIPQFERFECDSPLVDVRPGRNDPTARKYGRSGLLTDVQGELDLHLRVRTPSKPQLLQTECKFFFKYGKSVVPITFYIHIPFTTGPLAPDAESITFAAARPEELKGQTRLVHVSVRDGKSDVLVRQVPDWLECKIVSREGNKVLLSLKIKDRPPKPFVSANLHLAQSSGDPTIVPLPIRVFAAGG
jgi:hypothetical protein